MISLSLPVIKLYPQGCIRTRPSGFRGVRFRVAQEGRLGYRSIILLLKPDLNPHRTVLPTARPFRGELRRVIEHCARCCRFQLRPRRVYPLRGFSKETSPD